MITNAHWSPRKIPVNPLNPELNPICYLLALLGAHHFLILRRNERDMITNAHWSPRKVPVNPLTP